MVERPATGARGHDLRTVEHITVPTEGHEGHDAVIGRMIAGIERLEGVAGGSGRVASVGVAVPGLIDMVEGVTFFLPNLPGMWREVPVGRKIREATGYRTSLINDVRAFTVGELELGAAKGYETALCYAVGTGIGGGVITHGRVHFGLGGAAGELGHMVVDPQGPRCGCGNRGCAETVASGTAVVAAARRAGLDASDAESVFMAEAGGDPRAAAAVRRFVAGLVATVVNAIHAYQPAIVVLTGGIMAGADRFLPQVCSEVAERAWTVPRGRVRVEPSRLGASAGVLAGAAVSYGSRTERCP